MASEAAQGFLTRTDVLDDTAVQVPLLQGLSSYMNAGGTGSRLMRVFTPHPELGVTKAMLKIGNPPIPLVEHQINKSLSVGIAPIVAGVGTHAHVADHVRSRYGSLPHVHAIGVSEQLGTGGDLLQAVRMHPDLFGEHVLISNVDTILDIREAALYAAHLATGADLTIALTRRAGVPNEGAFIVGHERIVTYCGEAALNVISEDEAAASSAYRGSSTGMLIVKREVLEQYPWEPDQGSLSLYRHIVGHTLLNGMVGAFDNGKRLFSDVGTVGTWNHVQQYPNLYQPHIQYTEDN